MGSTLVKRILASVEKIAWPQEERATAQGKHAYDVALEKVDDSRGDGKQLAAALRTALSGQSRPYAMAALAYILVAASQEADGAYDSAGLDAAMHWLEEAQALEPDDVDINFIEALIYVHNGRIDDARLVLNYLRGQVANHFRLDLAEVAYWEAKEDIEKAMYWYEQAMQSAAVVPQKMRLRVGQGDFLMRMGRLDEALQKYKEAVHFDKANPVLWHKMSLIFMEKENWEEALRCNQQALQLRDFPAARQVEERIKKQTGTTGMLGRLFGRS
jgi:tetratricopeptide (TPR) repeat protein